MSKLTTILRITLCFALVFIGFSIHRGFYNTDKPEWLEKVWKEGYMTIDSYNSDKDLYINSILYNDYNTYDITIGENTGTNMYEFYYDEIMFTIFYKNYVPYEHKEGWNFYATKRDGTTYIIEGSNKRNKLHWTTYLKIQEMWEAVIEAHSNHVETQTIRMDKMVLSPERRKEINDMLLNQLVTDIYN